ncbi:hypothetical protein ACFL10_01495, partial [Patescibacteria group bacterium]
MFDNPQNLFYIVITAVILLIGILLAIALVYLIMVLRDVSKATFLARDTLEKVNEFMYKPLTLASSVIENIRPIIENLQAKGEEVMKK